MYRQYVTFAISFILSGLFLLPLVNGESQLFYYIWISISLISIFSLIALRIYTHKNNLVNTYKRFWWVFDEETGCRVTPWLSILKVLLFITFAVMLFIPILKINITKESIAPLGMLIILLVERHKASIYEYDEVKSVKYSSWEVEMTKYELIVFYKSRAAFLTVGIFPLIVFIMYGGLLYKALWAVLIVLFSFAISHQYAFFLNRKFGVKK